MSSFEEENQRFIDYSNRIANSIRLDDDEQIDYDCICKRIDDENKAMAQALNASLVSAKKVVPHASAKKVAPSAPVINEDDDIALAQALSASMVDVAKEPTDTKKHVPKPNNDVKKPADTKARTIPANPTIADYPFNALAIPERCKNNTVLIASRMATARLYNATYVDDVLFPALIFPDNSAFVGATYIIPPMSDADRNRFTGSDEAVRIYTRTRLLETAEHNRCFFAAIMFNNPKIANRLMFKGKAIRSPWELQNICREKNAGPSFKKRNVYVEYEDLKGFNMSNTKIGGGFCDLFGVSIDWAEFDNYGIPQCVYQFNAGCANVLVLPHRGVHYPHILDPVDCGNR